MTWFLSCFTTPQMQMTSLQHMVAVLAIFVPIWVAYTIWAKWYMK